MKKFIVLTFIISICIFYKGFSFTLKDRLLEMQSSEYAIIMQNKIYSCIIFEKQKNDILQIVEMNFPINFNKNIKNFSWKNFIQKKELCQNIPRTLSHIIYEIDLEKNIFLASYDVKSKKYITSENNSNFLIKLLQLPLIKLNDDQRKKIGLPPLSNERDNRALWNPPQIVDGKKIKKTKYIVYKAIWPKDNSELSEKNIELYFDAKREFSFPFWIQVSTGNFDAMLKVIDSGKF